MAVRVTAAEVKAIMDNCTVTDPIVEVFILSASEVIDSTFASNTTITDSKLKELERWLTAHMLAMTLARMGAEEQIGEARIKYTGQWGKDLDATPYGQVLKTLDTTGQLAVLGKRNARMIAIKGFEE